MVPPSALAKGKIEKIQVKKKNKKISR